MIVECVVDFEEDVFGIDVLVYSVDFEEVAFDDVFGEDTFGADVLVCSVDFEEVAFEDVLIRPILNYL